MLADAGGWASQIPRDRMEAWQARKADLLARIRAHERRPAGGAGRTRSHESFVDDLLTLAKSERPDFLRLEPVDVAALSGELLSKARSLGKREWHLEATGRATIVADRQRLTQAMMQLAENATAPR